MFITVNELFLSGKIIFSEIYLYLHTGHQLSSLNNVVNMIYNSLTFINNLFVSLCMGGRGGKEAIFF